MDYGMQNEEVSREIERLKRQNKMNDIIITIQLIVLFLICVLAIYIRLR